MKNSFVFTCAALAALQIAWMSSGSALPSARPAAAPAAATTSSSAETRFVTLINDERTARGEAPLTVDPLLQSAARAHCREMCVLNYFDHVSPTPGMATPMDRYFREMHDACRTPPSAFAIGENIYFCSVFDTRHNADSGHESLMHSPPHRANILDARYTKIGVGVYVDPSGAFWVTQMFLRDQP